jgi:hypothetical protein
MVKLTELSNEAQEFVTDLTRSLRKKSSRVSAVQLARLTGVAFEMAFTGSQREEKLARAMARGISVREKMAAEEGGSMSADETARYLGVSKQSVLNLHSGGKLLAWRSEKQRAFRFPVWQFTERGRLPGLEEVLTILRPILDDWGKIGFFLQTQGALGGRRPLDLLRENKVQLVLRAAEAYVS